MAMAAQRLLKRMRDEKRLQEIDLEEMRQSAWPSMKLTPRTPKTPHVRSQVPCSPRLHLATPVSCSSSLTRRIVLRGCGAINRPGGQ